ncbi:MAG: hypothetical protein ACFFFG_16020 [Candidatus Thorarchaeota archaeon]
MKKKKGELEKEVTRSAFHALIGALFGMNPGSISYLLTKHKLGKYYRKRERYDRYREYEKIR